MKTIDIKGTIVPNDDKEVYDFFGMDATSPNDVLSALKEAGDDDITMVISSGGGDVISANEIYYAVKMYQGNVTADISGWACSASSYIALSADKVRMTPTSMFMIHNVSGGAMGDYHAMDKESRTLKNFNKAIATAYRMKTGMGENDILNLMDKESWLSAEQAMNYGFIDEIIGNDDEQVEKTSASAFYNATANVIPQKVVAEVKEKLMKAKVNEIQNNDEQAVVNAVDDVPTLTDDIVENIDNAQDVTDVIDEPITDDAITEEPTVDYSAKIYIDMMF